MTLLGFFANEFVQLHERHTTIYNKNSSIRKLSDFLKVIVNNNNQQKNRPREIGGGYSKYNFGPGSF